MGRNSTSLKWVGLIGQAKEIRRGTLELILILDPFTKQYSIRETYVVYGLIVQDYFKFFLDWLDVH